MSNKQTAKFHRNCYVKKQLAMVEGFLLQQDTNDTKAKHLVGTDIAGLREYMEGLFEKNSITGIGWDNYKTNWRLGLSFQPPSKHALTPIERGVFFHYTNIVPIGVTQVPP